MKILSIDTSCDETAAAVTEGTKVLSNVIWSQASLHAKFGGVMPSLAQRMHEEHIDWVIDKTVQKSKIKIQDMDAIAVTIGPGLSIALGVGINKAKELSKKYHKKLIAVSHLEGHILSSLANKKYSAGDIKYPALGLVISGGNTLLAQINKIGEYKVLAQTMDDALGEALDKAARMLGLGYPGGAILEKLARDGDIKSYSLPIPISGQENRKIFTYSGLKTAMMRMIEKEKGENKNLTKQQIYNLAACFQDVAFTHLIRVVSYVIRDSKFKVKNLLIGGGVSANVELRKRLRKLCKQYDLEMSFPYSEKITGDNAAMIGIAAYFKSLREEFINPDIIDRDPNLKINQ
jgi:N6-L-threonylcarbamoyladenine synthase